MLGGKFKNRIYISNVLKRKSILSSAHFINISHTNDFKGIAQNISVLANIKL